MHLAFTSFWLLQLRSMLWGRATEFGCILRDVFVITSFWKLIFASAHFRSVWNVPRCDGLKKKLPFGLFGDKVKPYTISIRSPKHLCSWSFKHHLSVGVWELCMKCLNCVWRLEEFLSHKFKIWWESRNDLEQATSWLEGEDGLNFTSSFDSPVRKTNKFKEGISLYAIVYYLNI